MAISVAGALGIVAGATFAISGVALIAIRPPRRGILAFGAFAVLIGVEQAMVYLAIEVVGSRMLNAMAWPIMGMAGVALALAATEYTSSRRTWIVWTLVVPAAAGAILLFVDPARTLLPSGGANDLGVVVWQMPVYLAAALGSFLLARHFRTSPSPRLRTESLLLLLAILPHLAYVSTFSLIFVFRSPEFSPTFYLALWCWAYIVTFGIGILTATLVVAMLWRDGTKPALRLAAFTAFVAVCAAVQLVLYPEYVVFGGAVRILAAIMLAYGLLKYGLFDVDLKLKWSLDRGSVLAIFGVVFFLVEQAAEFFVSAAFGALAGLVAAALLLLALRPIRKATARLADRAFPHVHQTAEYFAARKLVVYRSAAEAAAKDGVITEREREMLAALVRELEIEPDVVATVEREVLAGAAAG